jgi:predicted metal-binding protein
MPENTLTQKARRKIGSLLTAHGVDDFVWIDPRRIITAQWVRLKCMYGCASYGRKACCPPNTPTVAECERFLREYRDAVLFRIVAQFRKAEGRLPWNRQISSRLSRLERDIFVSGHERVFLLSPAGCALCAKCSGQRETCVLPASARPTPEAMAIDVYSTVRRFGYPIAVRRTVTDEQNRYGFLLIH